MNRKAYAGILALFTCLALGFLTSCSSSSSTPPPVTYTVTLSSVPASVTVNGSLVYVLNNKSASISGFRVADGTLTGLPGSSRPLSDPGADPAQVSFTPDGTMLLVTERGTNSISRYLVDDRGYAGGLTTIKSSGQTPYGFACTSSGTVLVTEAFGCAAGEAAALGADAGRELKDRAAPDFFVAG